MGKRGQERSLKKLAKLPILNWRARFDCCIQSRISNATKSPKINQMRRLERSGSPEQGQAASKDPEPLECQIPLKQLQRVGRIRHKRASTCAQKAEILKNSYSCLYKHLRSSNLQKYPNFRTKRAGRPKYEGRLFFAPKKEYRDYADVLN